MQAGDGVFEEGKRLEVKTSHHMSHSTEKPESFGCDFKLH